MKIIKPLLLLFFLLNIGMSVAQTGNHVIHHQRDLDEKKALQDFHYLKFIKDFAAFSNAQGYDYKNDACYKRFLTIQQNNLVHDIFELYQENGTPAQYETLYKQYMAAFASQVPLFKNNEARLRNDYATLSMRAYGLARSSAPTPQAACTNMDFETGNVNGWTVNTNISTSSGAGVAFATTPGPSPYVSSVTQTFGGNYSGCIDALSTSSGNLDYVELVQTFMVTAQNQDFIFNVAVIVNAGAHACADNPKFDVSVTNSSGAIIPCSNINLIGSASGGGSCSTYNGWQTSGSYDYLNWTPVIVPLQAYIGQNVTIKYRVQRCNGGGGHGALAYIEGSCNPQALTGTGHVVCNGSPVQLFGPQIPGYTYSWTSTNGFTANTQSVSVTQAGTYSVTVSNGTCQMKLDTVITAVPSPTASFNYTVAPCAPSNFVPVQSTSTANAADPFGTYTWVWNDNTANGSGVSSSHTYTSTGTKTVKLVVKSQGGCKDSTTQTFNFNPGPTANFTFTSVCTGNSASFASTSTPTAGIAAQVWHYGDNSTNGSGNTTSHTYTVANTYSVKLVVTNSAGCKDSITKPVVINAKPTVTFTTSPVCFGSPTNFNNTSTIAAPSTITNWYWDFDNNTTVDNTTMSPAHTYTGTGSYTAELKAVSNNGCMDSTTVLLTVNPVPAPAFAPVNACMNNVVVLNNTSTVAAPDNIAVYQWSFGAGASPGTTSSLPNPSSLTYNSSGVKTITLTATSNNSCTATITKTVMVLPQPTAAFAASSICGGTATTFTDQSTPTAPSTGSVTAWAWDFTNDGTIDNTTASPSQTYAGAGTYTAVLVVTSSNGCKDTVKVPVNVWGHASIDFDPTNVCFGTATTFTDQTITTAQPNTGTVSGWAWDFGNGSSSTVQNPVNSYTTGTNANTTYSVELAVTTSHGCKDSLTKVVTVYALPTASFTADSVCLNSISHLTDITNGNGNTVSGYAWDFTGDNVADVTNVANPNYTFPAYGNNAVTFTASTSPVAGLSCKNAVTQNVWVHPQPVPAFSFTNACINAQPMNYDASTSSVPVGTNTLYAWSYGDGQTGSGVTSSHSYATASVYNVTLAVTSDKGCMKTLVQQTEVYQKPFVSFTSAKTCAGSPTTFNGVAAGNSGNIAQWLWDFNNTISTIEGNGQQTSFSYAAAGTKTVTLISVTDKNCRDTLTRQIYVNYVPKPQFTVNKPAGCPLHCVTFTDQTPAVTGPAQIVNWTWRFGDGTTVSANSNAPQSFCYNNTSSSQSALFDVTLIATSDSACVDSVVKQSFITVYPVPVAAYTVNPNPGSVTEPLEYFTNESQDYNKWWWGFGDGGPLKQDSVNVNPTHYYNSDNANTYPTQLIVANQYGCRDTAQLDVVIGPEFVFYIPNCFTPGNNDGINDMFTGKGIGITRYEMWIFDRWGNMIYYTDDINKAWDGKVQGKQNPVQQDVYVWKVKLVDVFSKKHDYVGHVTVLRGGGN